MTQTHDEQVAYNANRLKTEEVQCIVQFIITNKIPSDPTGELMFGWCTDHDYIEYDYDKESYYVTQKGLDYVSM